MKRKEDFVGFEKHEYNPIIRPKTETLLREILQKFKPTSILEIGTYLGYSSVLMLESCPSAHVVTLEKDEQNFSDACKNLAEYKGRVELICCDAFDFLKLCVENIESVAESGVSKEISVENFAGKRVKYEDFLNANASLDENKKFPFPFKQFDLIFLDGPKGQYHKYLPYLKQMLNCGGVLVCDDVLFYGLVNGDGKVKHKHRSIVEHLRKFLTDLQADANFETKIYDFEDGVSVSVKKY